MPLLPDPVITPEIRRLVQAAEDRVADEFSKSEPVPHNDLPGWMRPKRRILVQKAEVGPELTKPSRVVVYRRYTRWHNKLKGVE